MDKLMIWNPGELPPSWTLAKLLGKHASIPFNPDVANVFFRTGMIEAWGRGIERILEACRAAGTPEPEVRYETIGLWLVFHFLPEHQVGDLTTAEMADGAPVETSVETPTPAKTSVETSVETPTPVRTSVETSVETPTPVETPVGPVKTSVKTSVRILELLEENPEMTLAQVASLVGRSTRAVELAASKLVRSGRLRYVGPRKKGHWEVLK